MTFLTPCEVCHRHVLSDERACPFCGTRVTASMRARVPRVASGRLGRAAMMALGAVVVGTQACGGGSDGGDANRDSSASKTPGSGTGSNAPSAPGSLPTSGGGAGGAPVAPPDEPMAVAEYGVAIMEPMPGAGGGPAMPEPEPVMAAEYGVPALEPEPLMGVPEYGAPILPPEPTVAVEPEVPAPGGTMFDAGASNDAGTGGASSDAGAAGAGLSMGEPEPLPVAEYGVPPLSLD